jgi:hypothetical protein
MEVAKRLGDNCSLAYGQSSFVHTSTILSPLPLDSLESFVRDALRLSDRAGDTYLRTWVLFTIAWDYLNRGLTREARDYAERVLDAARDYVDPRGFGVGLWLLGWVDIGEERYQDAAARADECIRAALTPLDRSVGIQIKGLALALSGKVEEGAAMLREVRSGFLANDWRFNLAGTDLALSVATVLAGAFSQGIRLCEKCIREQEAAGYQAAADWARLNLAEIYLEMLTSEEKPPLKTILKNVIFLLRLKVSGPARINRLLDKADKNTQFSERGILRARIEFGFARLYAIQGRSVLTHNHLARAKRIAEGLCTEPLLARIDKLDRKFV